jgi:hypothetical protein
MKRMITLFMIGLMAFALNVKTVQAQTNSTDVTIDRSRVVVSPYFEAGASGFSYTYIGISHPSLSNANSAIGMTLTAVGAVRSSDGASNPSVAFTIQAGQTQRVIIATTNHLFQNESGANSQTTYIITTANGANGWIKAVASCENTPALLGTCGSLTTSTKYANLSQLSFWGAIVITSTLSGFAMEFVGDAHDSNVTSTTQLTPADGVFGGPGRGIN